MPNMHRLVIEDGPLYKDASIRFDSGKIVLIQGRNNATKRTQSNGAGKSLLFAYLADVLGYSQPMATSRKQSAGKKALFTKDTRVMYEGEHNGFLYRIEKSLNAISIFCDGEDTQVRTQALALEYIRQWVFPMSETDFYTTCFLKPRRFSIILDQNDTNRRSFFETLFKLDAYTLMQKEFSTELSRLDKVWAQRAGYERVLETVKVSAWGGDTPETIDENLTVWTSRVALVTKELATTYEYAAQLRTLAALRGNLPRVKIDPKSLADNKERLAYLQENADIWAERTRILDAIRALEPELKKVQAQFVELTDFLDRCEGIDDSNVDEYLLKARQQEKLLANQGMWQSKAAGLKKLIDEYNFLEDGDANFYVTSGYGRDALNHEYTRHQLTLETYNAAKLAHDSECVLCGHEVTASLLRDRAKDSHASLEQISWALERLDYVAELEGITASLTELDNLGEQYTVEDMTRIAKHIRVTKPAVEARIAQLAQQIASHKPAYDILADAEEVDPKEIESLRVAIAKAEGGSAAQASFDRHLAAIYSLPKPTFQFADVPPADTEPEALDAGYMADYIRALQERQVRAQTKLTETQSAKRSFAEWKATSGSNLKTKADAEAKIAEIDAEMKYYAVVEALVKAYSNKGIKLQKLSELMEILTTKLNEFAPIMFTERMKFQIEVAEGRFGIMVKRPGDAERDVAEMSDSEGQRFILLTMMAILVMQRPALRCNAAILDEMTSHADPVTLEAFVLSFVPALHKILGNVFVINPCPLDIEGAVTVTAVKEKKDGTHLECSIPDLIGQ